jgi:predicted  nucleic acid-binding Zn-ribbon protein
MAQFPLPEQQQKHHPGLFHKNSPNQKDYSAMSEDLGNVSRRLRVLEESITNFRRQIQVSDHNMLERSKTFATELRSINSDISEMKRGISSIREKVIEIVNELESVAKLENVKVLEKYINFWNPIKFVTHNEVEQIIKEYIKKEKNSANKSVTR